MREIAIDGCLLLGALVPFDDIGDGEPLPAVFVKQVVDHPSQMFHLVTFARDTTQIAGLGVVVVGFQFRFLTEAFDEPPADLSDKLP